MRTSNIRFFAVAALAALALAACSSSSKTSTPTTTTPTPAATTPTTVPAGPATTTGGGTTTASATVKEATTSAGQTLVNSAGMTLYTYANDTAGTSACTGQCASVWPPLVASGTPTYGTGLTASKFSTITRSDGTKQIAYNGKPLYTFQSDTAAGQTSGQGVGGFSVATA